MRVSSVEPIVVRIPLERPAAHATRRSEFRDYTLVRLRTDEGVEGHSYCIGGTFVASCLAELAPVVIGREPDARPALWEELYASARALGRRGAPMVALSALDNALWDLHGSALGLPLYRILGVARTEAPAYASGGVYIDGATIDDLAAEYRAYASAGFPAVKMRIGRLDPAEDIERVRVVREAIGPDLRLGLDANASWAAVDSALRFLDAVEDSDIAWIEEPFHPEAEECYRALALRCPVPISAGEQESGRWAFARMIESGAVSILQPDVTVIGGVTEWLRVAGAASCFSKPLLPHYFPALHIHLACSCPSVRWVEYVPPHKLVNADLLFTEPVVPHNGVFRPPAGPGFGLTIDWDAVARYRLAGVAPA